MFQGDPCRVFLVIPGFTTGFLDTQSRPVVAEMQKLTFLDFSSKVKALTFDEKWKLSLLIKS